MYIYIYFFFRKSCRLCDNVGKYCRAGQATDDNMAPAHCMLDTKCTNANSEYVILIAFPLQQWLHKRAWMVRYTHTDCLVINVWELRITKCKKFLKKFYPLLMGKCGEGGNFLFPVAILTFATDLCAFQRNLLVPLWYDGGNRFTWNVDKILCGVRSALRMSNIERYNT